jgi:hypothetical protein
LRTGGSLGFSPEGCPTEFVNRPVGAYFPELPKTLSPGVPHFIMQQEVDG